MKVFEAFAGLLPTADLFALTIDPQVQLQLGGRYVRRSFLDRSRFLRDRRDLTLPLMPLAWRWLRDEGNYDLVITLSLAGVKGFWHGRKAKHLCYCHTPMRYVWEPQLDQRGAGGIRSVAAAALRNWDLGTNRYVDSFAANSREVADRLYRHYSRSARVITPPVDVDYFLSAPHRERSGALAVSRWVPYKRLDLAIAACIEAKVPLTLAGSGPEESRLRAQASVRPDLITITVAPTDDELRDLYASSEFLLFPGLEDFGIIPVEAMATGTPVLALSRGGTSESVVHGETGILVDEQSVAGFTSGIKRIRESTWSEQTCRDRARLFSFDRFALEVRQWLLDETGVEFALVRDGEGS